MFWTFIVLGIVMWLLQGLLNIYQLKKFNKELKNLRHLAESQSARPEADLKQVVCYSCV